ncbi:hypothetical protein FB45DRAFT_842168 [Roridomyces roridus]|uniref:Uncharacterized protein n=1 Tax=Roridomyces roridus TaxID=1738132 RepID=A0AAD7B9T0_9AGAR|nr:hypothetical protein FB45DRAFT_842168 [Roridomyces roridus]
MLPIQTLPAVFAATLVSGLSTSSQIPLQYAPKIDGAWENLGLKPSPNDTAPLIFDTVNSLLQHWPNTRYRNGHTVVPGTIPIGTLLYHGRADSSLPDAPDWTAVDPEHSFPFCGSPGLLNGNASAPGCWHLTIAVTRPLKVLYFDGSSAVNMKFGTLDSQDLLLWGEVRPDMWLAERKRIDGLCAWGKQLGVDAYVRMEMDFEVMLCDFHSGVKLVSADYLTGWWPSRMPPPAFDLSAPPPASIPEDLRRIMEIVSLETVRGGSWHNRYPGDTRISLDLSKLVSFYDTELVPSLIPHRTQTERWDHRLQNISTEDVEAVTARVRAVLSDEESESVGSGVDWKTLYRVVVDRYADRLELLQHLLHTLPPSTEIEQHARTVQMQLRIMLAVYIPAGLRPSENEGDSTWAAPVWRACATRHTAPIHELLSLIPSERTLLNALDGTQREICRVVVGMWERGVRAGLDMLFPSESPVALDPGVILRKWKRDADALVTWLDWSVWVKCLPACGPEEMCYLPTWPYFFRRLDDSEDDPEFSWKRPQPRCVRQVAPYERL